MEQAKTTINPIRVTITGAAGQIGSVLCFMICQGRMFGPDQKVILQLLELPFAETLLQGLVMELRDCAFPLLADIKPTLNAEEAFDQADVAILVGAKPRGPGMERKDLLNENAKIFKEQGQIIDRVAKKTIKVLVVGNPANTNALIASHYAPSIPKENFTSMNRLDQNRALGILSQKLQIQVETMNYNCNSYFYKTIRLLIHIHNVIIWGNHSATMFVDVNHGFLETEDQKRISLREALNDDDYANDGFISQVAKRGTEIISVMKKSSVPSAANAACDHMHDWWVGTKPGVYASMGIISDGNKYGVAEGLIYSFPCECKNGEWKVVEGLSMDEFSNQKLKETEKELLEERLIALEY